MEEIFVKHSKDFVSNWTFQNKETDLIIIDAFSNLGFRLNNSMKCMGPIVVFPNIILSWNVENLRDIDENSLNIFTVKFRTFFVQ